MTSGNFSTFPIDKVWVNREKRQRRELPDIEGLAESIRRTGLINPPVITRDGELIAGERRLTALRHLGWTSIPIQYVDELSELELHIIEFEENVRRVDLPWQDRCLAVQRYHELRAAQDPEWTAHATAQALGMSDSEVREHRDVAKEIERGNSRVSDADRFSTARGIVRRDNERKKASAVAAIVAAPVMEAVADGTPPPPAKPVAPIILADFHEWQASYDGPFFNFIHCDFPYGVGMHKSDQGSGKSFGTYADDPDVYWKLLDTLKAGMKNVVAESAHLMFWFSMDFYGETKQLLEGMGWRVAPHPLIWFKNDNTGIIPDASRGPRRVYETAFYASRGDRLLTQAGAASNVCAHPGREKSIHMNEKPVPMLRHFMRMFVDDYSLVLDPTAGSGNALKAAERLGANTCLGLERDEEFYARAVDAYYGDEDVAA